MNLPKSLLVIYLFLVPFDGTDYLNIYLGFIHITIADLLLALLLYTTSINAFIRKQTIPRIFWRYFTPFLAAIICSIVSLANIPVNTISYDLKFTLNLIEYISLFFIVTMVVDDMRELRKLLIVFVASTVFFSLLTLAKSFGVHLPGFERIVNGRIGPFFIGTVALFNGIMPFSLIILGSLPVLMKNIVTSRKWSKTLLIFIVLLAAVVSFSRSLWIAISAQIFLYWYLNVYSEMSLRKKWLVLLSIVPGLLVMFQFLYDAMVALIELRSATVTHRLVGFDFAFDLISTNVMTLLMGMGKGAYIQKSLEVLDEGTVVHNFLIDIFVTKGLFTMLAIISVLFMILRQLYAIHKEHDPSQEGLAEVFLLLLAGVLVEGMFAPITSSILFWTFNAMAYSFISLSRKGCAV